MRKTFCQTLLVLPLFKRLSYKFSELFEGLKITPSKKIKNLKSNVKAVVNVHSNRTFTDRKVETFQSYREVAIDHKVTIPPAPSYPQNYCNSLQLRIYFRPMSLLKICLSLIKLIHLTLSVLILIWADRSRTSHSTLRDGTDYHFM